MNQSNLTPKEQATLFELLKRTGQQPTSGGMAQTVPDAQAQQPMGEMDANGMQQLFQAPTPPPGHFKDDPQGAIDHISGVLAQSNGAQLTAGPQGAGYLEQKVPAVDPVGKLFGLKRTLRVDPTNYYPTLVGMLGQSGADKILPANTATGPNGEKHVSKDQFEQLVKARSLLPTSSNPMIDKQTAIGLGIKQSQADKLYGDDAAKTIPLTELRLAGVLKVANAREAGVANQQLNTLLQYGGPGAAQQAMKDAYSRLSNLTRADGLVYLIDQVQGGKADKRQRALMQMEVARAINPSGVLTNEALDELATDSFGQKVGNIWEYLSNKATPVQFKGFMTGLKELVDQEKSINSNLFTTGSQMGLDVIKGTNPGGAAVVDTAIKNNPVLNPKPQPTTAKKKSLDSIFGKKK